MFKKSGIRAIFTWVLISMLIFSTGTSTAQPSQDDDTDLVIYITDQYGNSYKEIINADGIVHHEETTKEEILAYLSDTASTEEHEHSWGSWQLNSSFYFRNCTECGEVQRQCLENIQHVE